MLPDPAGGAYASFTRATLLGRLIMPNRHFVGLPYNVVVDRGGRVRYARSGSRFNELSAAVAEVVGQP